MSNQSNQYQTEEHFFEDHFASLYLQESDWVVQENGAKTYSGQVLNAAKEIMATQVKGSGCYFQKGGLIPRSHAYKKKADREDLGSWEEIRKGGFVLPITVGRSSEVYKYISEVERAIMTLASEKKLTNNSHKLVSKLQKYESTYTTKFDIDQFCLTKYHVQDFLKPMFKTEDNPIPDEKSLVPDSFVLYPSSFSIVSNTRSGTFTFHVKFRAIQFVIAPRMTSDEVFEQMITEPTSAYQRAIAKLMAEELPIGGAGSKRERPVTQHQPSDDEIIPDSEDDDETISRRAKRSRK